MNRYQLLSSIVLTGSGQTGAFDVAPGTYDLTATISAASGTSQQLTLWLQQSDDGGTTWHDVILERRMDTSASAADPTVDSNKRNIFYQATAALQTIARVTITSDKVRAKYILAGTSQQFTVSASLNGVAS